MAPSRAVPAPTDEEPPEHLASFLKRINFDVDLSPGAKQKASLTPKQVAPSAPPRLSSANASASVKVAKLKPAAPVEAKPIAAPVPHKVTNVKPSTPSVGKAIASPVPRKLPVKFLYSPKQRNLTSPPSTPEGLWAEDIFLASCSLKQQQPDSAPLDKNSPEHKERLLAIFKSDVPSKAGHVLFQSLTPSTSPSQRDTSRSQSRSPSHFLPVDYIQHTLRSSSIGATMAPVSDNFGLGSSRYAHDSPRLSITRSSGSLRGPPSPYNPLAPLSGTGGLRPQAPQIRQPPVPSSPLGYIDYIDNEPTGHSSPQVPKETLFQRPQAFRPPGRDFEDERTHQGFLNHVHKRAAGCDTRQAQQAQQMQEEERQRREDFQRRVAKERQLRFQVQHQRENSERRISIARQTELQGEDNQRRVFRRTKRVCEDNDRHRKEEAERQRLAHLVKLKTEEEQKQRQSFSREREEAERAAELKREQDGRRIAKLKVEDEKRQRVAKLKAEEEKRRGIATLKAEEEERQLKAEKERQRMTELKTEEERKAREFELLMQDLRQDASCKIQGVCNARLEAYGDRIPQLDDEISSKAAEIKSFEQNIANKEAEIADIEEQLENLKLELSGMTSTKMRMDKDLRKTQFKKAELNKKAQKLRQDVAVQLEKLQDTSLSSEDVEKILGSFITTDDQIEVPDIQLSRLSLRDRSECGEDIDGKSSGDDEEEEEEEEEEGGGEVKDIAPVDCLVFWAWKEDDVEADRVVKLVNLPINATVVEVQALIWGGPLAQIVYTPGSTEARVYFLIGQDAQKYYNATANHIPYPGNEDRLIRVEKCNPSPRHPFLRWALKAGVTRNILTTGILPGWTRDELRKFAGKHGREVEQVLFGKTKSGVRVVEFRFLNIHHANAFKYLLKTDIDFYKVKTEYAKDQCAVHRNVHTRPR